MSHVFALTACLTAAASLHVATAAKPVTVEEWRDLVRQNAASNPLAEFDENDLSGFDGSVCEGIADDTTHTGNGMPAREIQSILAPFGDAPSVDWRKKGAVTPVKNQGAFGTCWSFAAAENLEGLNARQGNKLENISNQELIDCCKDCQGRSADASFNYLGNNTGGTIDTEASYPYLGPSTACKADKGIKSPVKLNTHGRVQDDGTGAPIVAALIKYGPMGHGVDATCFAGYKGGIITNCTKASIDHAVLMVAAGTDQGVDYYTIKNSWGAKWGEHGYVRVKRGSPKQCGIGSTVWTM